MGKALDLTYHPNTFFKFVLIGFSLITLPLIGGMVATSLYVERLFLQSESAIYRASEASLVSRALVDQLTAMERSARQYHVLRDTGLLNNYVTRRDQFNDTAAELAELSENSFLNSQVLSLQTKEHAFYNNLSSLENIDGFKPEVEFAELNVLGRSILDESQRWITEQVVALSRTAQQVENYLYWLIVFMVPATVVISIVISIWIARPIRQVDDAIRRLGDGKFDAEITVSGPKDLQLLGERINWLRLRLVELEEKKSRFMGLVSHELKTPLTAIREGSSLLGEGALGAMTSSQKNVADLLQRNAITLQKMIENLLNLNMVFAKKSSMNVAEVDLKRVIDSVVSDHQLAILAKGIDLKLDVEKVVVQGDQEKLRIVVDNLISNAVKYSSDHSDLSVTLKKVQENIQLDVKDTGPGIAPEDVEQVFETFYRGRTTPNSDIRGSGLGLSIVKEFTLLHHGQVNVIHEEGQVGAHFRVLLPA